MRQRGVQLLFLLGLAANCAGTVPLGDTTASRMGERLFSDPRFAFPGSQVSCATCHQQAVAGSAGIRLFDDSAALSAVPAREDGRTTTPRNASPLVDVPASDAPTGWGLLHWDGEFASLEDLVAGTFTGRNFGWLPSEKAEAVHHFARMIRQDKGGGVGGPSDSYGRLLQDGDGIMPEPREGEGSRRLDPATASDDEILSACARMVAGFLRTLRLSRDAAGLHDGSPYDVFLELNRLPRAPNPGEAPARYARRLHEAVAALRAPKFVDDPSRRLKTPGQPFRFGALELQGMQIFFRGSIGYVRTASAGNCIECHVPPDFTDRAFHNNGATQDAYDSLHGTGAFAKLEVPDLGARLADYDRWSQPTPRHPRAGGLLASPPSGATPGRADLGLWNVYANPDIPAPQPILERKLNPDGRLSPDAVLALTLARFKTPSLRGLGQSGPYLHDGRLTTVEEVLQFYRRMSGLAQHDRMRNPPPEYAAMRLEEADLVPLAAFLRALNEEDKPTSRP